MLYVQVEGLEELKRDFENAVKQLPFAYSKGLNDLGFLIREKEIETIKKVFDRPKPQTARNVWVSKGNKTRPSVSIWFDQIYPGDEYMVPQVEGGARSAKRSEKLLGRYYVPGAGAKMDRYGNMQGGQVTQILSRLKKFGEVGFSMNQTAASAKRRRGAGKTMEYFVLPANKNGLPAGVYQRTQSGTGFGGKTSKGLSPGAFQKGSRSYMVQDSSGRFVRSVAVGGRFASVIKARGVIPVMIFTRQPTYKKRFPYFEVAQQTIDTNYRSVMSAAIDTALTGIRR